ncbi:hypothetical protein WA026_011470 [Henosepilachna vigintioctopunctata]|uniref:DUF4455 domain-containing protein n=1 Tax=Henosepilachna vigintioctopunctata TaxID=420089 RepID=A0AAW1TKV1_9CUCU
MKRSKKEAKGTPTGSIKRNSLVKTSKHSERNDSKDETRSNISRDGPKHKSKKGKSRKRSSEKAENLPKIIENFEEESEELLMEEMDLWKSLQELVLSSDKPGVLREKMYPEKLGLGGRDDCEDICKQKCLDSRIRLPPIKRTNSENILWDIRGLSASQPVESIPVLVVDRVNVRRKERHDNILMQLSSKMNEVNEIIEKEIRKQAENVVAHINLIKENVDNILDIIEEKQCVGLGKNVINRMQEIMKQLNDNRLSKIDSFCNFVRKLEAQRSESFKHILKKVYKDMHDNMYLLPYEIQKFFENKIQHLNQITMNNYHCYTELEGKLKLQMEEEMKIWFQKLKIYEKIKKRKTNADENLEAAQEADEISGMDVVRGKKREIGKKLDEAEANFQDLLQVTSNSLYLRSHHILDIYRTYLTEMMHVATNMIRADIVDHSDIQLGFASIHALSVQYDTDEDEIRDIIREGIRDITQSLDSNLKNFSHSTRIFDTYVDRMLEMAELCKKQLYLTLTRNDKATMRMNTNINILVDKLRQDSSENNLDKTMSEIMSIVSNIDAMLLSNLKEEVSVVDRVHQLTMFNVELMIDEIGRFVEQIPPPSDSDPRVMKKRASWLNFEELKNNDHLFSEDFLNCRFMIDAINNWQFGIWQALITIMDYSKHAISNIVLEKSNNKKRKLKYRCELKMKMNNLRMQSIREDFYKVRLIELRAHDDRLKQHRMGVEENIIKLNHLQKEMELLCRDFIDTKYLPEIQKAMLLLEKVTKKRHLNDIKQNVRYLHSTILREMKPIYDRISSAHFKILTNLKNSHLMYLKSIRFFSEDGNYNVDEVKNLKKQMGLLEKRLSKEFNTHKNTIKKTYDAFLEECRIKEKTHLHSLDKSIEEFTFKEEIERKIKELNGDIGMAFTTLFTT